MRQAWEEAGNPAPDWRMEPAARGQPENNQKQSENSQKQPENDPDRERYPEHYPERPPGTEILDYLRAEPADPTQPL